MRNTNGQFSGFQDQKQEAFYCRVVEKLIQTLVERLLQFYNNGKSLISIGALKSLFNIFCWHFNYQVHLIELF